MFLLINVFILCITWSGNAIKWESADSGQLRWSFNCDFNGGDIGSQKGKGEDCGSKCLARQDCTRFTWTDFEGGTCWLKSGDAQVMDVQNNGVCGEVMNRKPQAGSGNGIKWESADSGQLRWSFNCDFNGGDIGSQKGKGEDCGSKCLARQDCTRFTWTDYEGGTCWLKTGNAQAVNTQNNGVCGEVMNRQPQPPSQPGAFNRDYVGVAFSPYTKHWEGTKLPYWNSYSLQDIKSMLSVVNGRFTHIATYGMGVGDYNKNNKWDQADANCLVARAAAQINREKNRNAIKMAQGINQMEDQNLQQKEISNAFSAAQDANAIHANTVWGLTFTNEYFTNEDTGNRILNMIKSNKAKAHQVGLKVGTRIHVCGIIMNGGSKHDVLANIVRESDFIMCNLYPADNIVNNVHNAVEGVGNAFLSYVPKFRAINPKIDVMIGETGWPSEGVSFNHSPNNVQNLRAYWTAMGEWAAKHRVLVHMFEAIDEPWKSSKTSHDTNSPSGPNGGEGHYGWWRREDTNQGPRFVEK